MLNFHECWKINDADFSVSMVWQRQVDSVIRSFQTTKSRTHCFHGRRNVDMNQSRLMETTHLTILNLACFSDNEEHMYSLHQ